MTFDLPHAAQPPQRKMAPEPTHDYLEREEMAKKLNIDIGDLLERGFMFSPGTSNGSIGDVNVRNPIHRRVGEDMGTS